MKLPETDDFVVDLRKIKSRGAEKFDTISLKI